ncbi:MAG: NADH-quinone oxidoreductase subunit N [Chloroflexi bacterium]|nr:NADH-quinone oxidoreductase subunit N [Chloroflexota bacterium]
MNFNLSGQDFYAILPEVVLVVWGSLLLLHYAFWGRTKDYARQVALWSGMGFALALLLALAQLGRKPFLAFQGMVIADAYAAFLVALFAFSGLIGIIMAAAYLRDQGIERAEYYILLLFSVAGMMLMARVADLIMIFLALELFSIPLYVLAGFARPEPRSEEAALKYFLLGAFAAGFMLFGIALVYGATGSTSLPAIVEAVAAGNTDRVLLLAGSALVLVGLGFKVAAVPFHMWTPDVYHGAPTPVTGFMAVTAKTAGFAALLRLFVLVFPHLGQELVPVFWALAALSMSLGNVVAIAQRNIKRMLAYSSIAHAGYMLMALVAFGHETLAAKAVAAVLFYLVAYALATFGAWSVVILLERREGRGLNLDDYAGLARRYPWLAAAMAVFMLSFTGVPPTLGFFGKFYLFQVVLQAGFPGLALLGVLTSLISAYYYLRLVMIMYMRPGEPEVRPVPAALRWTVYAAALLSAFFGLVSAASLFTWAAEAILRLG